ncbi:M56 family metallopeptidase [Siphonobacter sp. SORGH_AS_1065]|uniref:M56 family metallopeptidase n=1 Tax=Siphonobacter sp. SORGH_AS_1065 TaxID=3041795 RepID=UPI00277D67ED|nr:M56 family metallopeptidase [Siphonobacter sp. SORGH_AS_1065]MDQ1085757.1 beta-lactamase regulating signal transducer with metallopeptidase domain [Siphonobacter sp. SORGH_AS_1065]
MNYLLAASLILTIFYAGYWALFRNLTFHTLNRFYLLLTISCSLLIPVLPVWSTQTVSETPVSENVAYQPDLQKLPIRMLPQMEPSHIDWLQVGFWLYGSVVAGLVLWLLTKLLTIMYQIRRQPHTSWNRLRVITTKKPTASFLKWVFLNESHITPSEREMVLMHEYGHYRRLHSLDILMVELFQCFFWFHPVAYWLKKSLVQIHEYEVDTSLAQQYGAKPYAQVLLTFAVSQQGMLTHSFARHPIKNRIEMLFTKSSSTMKKALFLLLLPLIALSLVLFAQHKVTSNEKPDLYMPGRASMVILEGTRYKPNEKNSVRTLDRAYLLGKNPVVIINGIRYNPSILEQIDPLKINMTLFIREGTKNDGKIVMQAKGNFRFTDNRKRTIAIRNAQITYKALTTLPASKAVVHVPQTTYAGNAYEDVYYMSKIGSTAFVSLNPGEKVEFYLDGVKHTEQEMNAIGRQRIFKMQQIGCSNGVATIKVFTSPLKEYQNDSE